MGCGASAAQPPATAVGKVLTPAEAAAAKGSVIVAKVVPTELSMVGSLAAVRCQHGVDCQLALRWDFQKGSPVVDLDACAIGLNSLGVVVGAAFYNNLSALDGALVHHGDSRDGAAEGDDEIINLDLDALPGQGVCTVALCVFAHKGGCLGEVKQLWACLRTKNEAGQWVDNVRVSLNGFGKSVTGTLMSGLYSADKGKTWNMRQLGHTFEGPRDFQSSIDGIRDACFAADIMRKAPPGKVLTEGTVYNMQKNDEAVLNHNRVIVGLGWELERGAPKIDLDASCIMLDGLGASSGTGFRGVLDVVWHNDTQAPGVVHSGDNRTGDGDGDDEQISIDMKKIDGQIQRLVFTVNSHNGTFKSVKKAWARVLDASSGKEMARYPLEHIETQAVVLCAFDKRAGGRWVFEAIGKGCAGKTAKSGECIDAVRGRPHRPIRELQQGDSVLLPPTMYDDDEDVITILDEWGCRKEWLWLDATVLLFAKDGRKLGEVDYNDLAWPKNRPVVQHSGDRQDEAKTHGSHEIRIKMLRLTKEFPNVFSVLLAMSAYSLDLSAAVKPFISLRDSDEAEIARFEPDTNFHATSIQMVDLHRHPESGWVLSAHGFLGDGKANEYGPIEQSYRLILQQIVAAGESHGKDEESNAPQVDYDAVRRTIKQSAYRRGPPIS